MKKINGKKICHVLIGKKKKTNHGFVIAAISQQVINIDRNNERLFSSDQSR